METRTHEKPTATLPEGVAVFCWLPTPGEEADYVEVVIDFDNIRAGLSISGGVAELAVGDRSALDAEYWGRKGDLVDGRKLLLVLRTIFRLSDVLGINGVFFTPAAPNLIEGWARLALRFARRYSAHGVFAKEFMGDINFIVAFNSDVHTYDYVRIDENAIKKFC